MSKAASLIGAAVGQWVSTVGLGSSLGCHDVRLALRFGVGIAGAVSKRPATLDIFPLG